MISGSDSSSFKSNLQSVIGTTKDFFLIFVCSFILGCSTYRLSNFTSKEKFYNEFNEFSKNKCVKVTLLNDSSLTIDNGAEIKNDTLYSIKEDNININKKVSISDTEGMVNTNKFQTASILLKNGEMYKAYNIEFQNDSINFSYHKKIIRINNITSMNNVRNISCRNHWIGIPLGFFGGAVIGFVAGLSGLFPVYDTEGNAPTIRVKDYTVGIIYGLLVGTIGGSIVGSIIGWNYIYIFNP